MGFWGLILQVAPEPGSWTDLLLGPAGLLVGALLALWLFLNGRVIPRSTHDETVADLKAQRDHWRSVAFHALGIGKEAVDLIAKEKS